MTKFKRGFLLVPYIILLHPRSRVGVRLECVWRLIEKEFIWLSSQLLTDECESLASVWGCNVREQRDHALANLKGHWPREMEVRMKRTRRSFIRRQTIIVQFSRKRSINQSASKDDGGVEMDTELNDWMNRGTNEEPMNDWVVGLGSNDWWWKRELVSSLGQIRCW